MPLPSSPHEAPTTVNVRLLPNKSLSALCVSFESTFLNSRHKHPKVFHKVPYCQTLPVPYFLPISTFLPAYVHSPSPRSRRHIGKQLSEASRIHCFVSAPKEHLLCSLRSYRRRDVPACFSAHLMSFFLQVEALGIPKFLHFVLSSPRKLVEDIARLWNRAGTVVPSLPRDRARLHRQRKPSLGA